VLAEEGGGFVHLLARQAIDDARVALVRPQEIEQLPARIVLLGDAVADVGPVEGADELARVLQAQALDDFVAGRLVGGGGERNARHVGPAFVQQVELAVFRAEVVAPLRDAVGLVNGEQGDGAAVEQAQEALHQQALGRDVEQVVVAVEQAALDGGRRFGAER
jgi:hypothetical protein